MYTPLPIFDSLAEHISNSSPVLRKYLFNDDLKISVDFLFQYRGSHTSYTAYRKEIERLLQWCEYKRMPLKKITNIDIEKFLLFCKNPGPSWIASQHFRRAIIINNQRQPNKNWRPFIKKANTDFEFSTTAMQATIAICNSFFNYLVKTCYLRSNPLNALRQKSKYLPPKQTYKPIRRISELQWIYVIETATKMADNNPKNERTLFIISALYALYLRISELAANDNWIPQMGHFYYDQDGNWWFKTLGKGNKLRDISVSKDMLKALKRYRLALGLAELPSIGETTPLIKKHQGFGPITSTRQIRKLVMAVFSKSIEQLRFDGHMDDAVQLRAATVHWLRHTGISDAVKLRPREHVRDDAGHSSSMITDKYIDVNRRERHASNKEQVLNPFDKS